mmetsp:Transcript_21428/g.47786  ORF Transcript_21428/g.47786 Transcript_21428/m.47786 type:complete len:569 (+) Transcript_21428:52-1758(+)
MIKALSFFLAAGAVAAHPGHDDIVEEATMAPCDQNRTCLEIYMHDFYGDGWDGAMVYLDTPWNEVHSYAPTCEADPVVKHLCTDTSGMYPMVLTHHNESYTPKNYWEAIWTVSAYKCEETYAHYTGGFNTTMIWNYDAPTDMWTLEYWENLWPNEKECDACGDAKACKPKPRKKKKNNKKKKQSVKGPMEDTSTNTSTKEAKTKPRYGPPAVNVRVTMYDKEGDGWWMDNYHGASWYLADDTRTELFYTGTLCKGKRGYCNLCLGDGSYTIRFTGEADDEWTAWDFCNVRGGYAHELTFHVYKGKCYPDSLVSLETTCNGTVASMVTLHGVVALGGFNSEIFQEQDASVMGKVIAEFVNGWEAEALSVTSTTLDARELVMSNRRASEFTFDVDFTVSFVAESTYGVDGRDFRAVENMISNLADKLSTRFASSEFVGNVNAAARLTSGSTLNQVRAAELVSLELDGITYSGVETMQASNLPALSDAYADYEQEYSYNYSTLALFFGALAVAFFAFVGILSHGMSGYQRVSDDSQHPTFAVPEVMPAELDESVGGKIGSLSMTSGTTSSL